MNWSSLYFGYVSRDEVQEAVNDDNWQSLRKQLRGVSLQCKYDTLIGYYNEELYKLKLHNDLHGVRMLEVRLTNYVTALSRGGLIKVGDYRN